MNTAALEKEKPKATAVKNVTNKDHILFRHGSLCFVYLLCFMVSMVTTQAHAKQLTLQPALQPALQAWQSQVPHSLKPANNNVAGVLALANDGVLIYPHTQKTVGIQLPKKLLKKKARFVSAAVVLNAKPAQVKALLMDYKNYPKTFPKLVSAKVLGKKNNLARVKYRAVIDIPVPILKFDKTFTFKHQVKGNTLSTWIELSPVKYGMGQFQWFAIKGGKHAGKTLLTITQWGDLDNLNGFVLRRIMKAMPELKMSIPIGVNAYVLEALRLHFNGKDKPASFTKAHILPSWQVNAKASKTLAQLLKHTQQFPVMYAHPPRKLKGETTLRFVSSLQAMPASQKAVGNWLLKPKSYPKLFKQVKKVTSKPHKKGELITTKVRVGLGVISIPFATKIYFEKPKANEAMFTGAGGDVRWVYGKFSVLKKQQHTQNNSVLMTTFTSKTDKNAPFLLRIGHALPYHDYLGAIGVAPILSYKVKKKLR